LRPFGGTVLLAAVLIAGPAAAGAWPMPKGETQVILKYDRQSADDGFDLDGTIQPLPVRRTDEAASVFAEHGLTDRFTLQMKAEAQRGQDQFVDYEGSGPLEIGLRAKLFENARTALSLYGGYVHAGEGRNAGYAAPGAGDGDWEVRLLAGRSGTTKGRWVGGRATFAEVQLAHVFRDGLPDETRMDTTVGLDFGPNWSVMLQSYAGRAEEEGQAVWLNGEASILRRLGDWRVQAGWRQALAGRETPVSSGPVVALWRKF